MPQHRAATTKLSTNPGEPGLVVLRRELLAGGGLTLGALLLTGCNGAKSTGALPSTYWSSPEAPQTVSAPPPSTVHGAPAMYAGQPSTVSAPPDFGPLPGIIPRNQWARIGVARPTDIFPMNGIRRITVHHDGMPPVTLGSMRQVGARIEQIRQSHVVGRGWADLGYHYVIDPSGNIWEGRSTRWQGAHVKDQNENNLGILVMGNFQVQTPTGAALSTLDRFLASQMQRYNISIGSVRTHQERAPTECPGRNLQQYMVRTRSGAGNLYALASRAGLTRG